jgi:GNAT superfamily N-acetyltransferase
VKPSVKIRRVPPEAIRSWYAELGGRWEEGGYYWGAFEGRRLIGYAGLIPSRRFSDAVYLHCAGVLPEARGKRLQRRLIRTRLAWARRSGYLWAVTYVMPYNVPSLRSLIACGFRPYTPAIAWGGRDVVYLTRSTERQT